MQMNKTFSFTGAKKIVFGNGSFDELVEHIKESGGNNPLIVLDKGLSETGFRKKVSDLLDRGGMKYAIFDRIEAEPALELADEGAKIALKEKCDAVVGIGGGSAMDVAKAVAVLAANKGKAVDYLGLNNVPGQGLPKIMVPTTAQTAAIPRFRAAM